MAQGIPRDGEEPIATYIAFLNEKGEYYVGKDPDKRPIFAPTKMTLYPKIHGVLIGIAKNSPELLTYKFQEFQVTKIGEPKYIGFTFDGEEKDEQGGVRS